MSLKKLGFNHVSEEPSISIFFINKRLTARSLPTLKNYFRKNNDLRPKQDANLPLEASWAKTKNPPSSCQANFARFLVFGYRILPYISEDVIDRVSETFVCTLKKSTRTCSLNLEFPESTVQSTKKFAVYFLPITNIPKVTLPRRFCNLNLAAIFRL